jgi:hypothetical protein
LGNRDQISGIRDQGKSFIKNFGFTEIGNAGAGIIEQKPVFASSEIVAAGY